MLRLPLARGVRLSNESQEHAVPPDLQFGHGFRVDRRAGDPLRATALSRVPRGLYARLPTGEVERVDSTEVDWSTYREEAPPTEGLIAGDHLLIESPAGSLRGELVEISGGFLRLRLPHGAELPVPLEPIRKIFLLLIKADLQPGDLFEVKSRSGNLYCGLVQQRVSPERILVELDSGKTVDLRLDRLRLETLLVRLPIPVAHLHGKAAPLEAEPRGRSARLKRASARVPVTDADKAPKPQARNETERLQRELLQKSLELELLREERERLAEENKERNRELESEVWRGLAVNRDLAEAKRRAESLEEELQRREAHKRGEKGGS